MRSHISYFRIDKPGSIQLSAWKQPEDCQASSGPGKTCQPAETSPKEAGFAADAKTADLSAPQVLVPGAAQNNERLQTGHVCFIDGEVNEGKEPQQQALLLDDSNENYQLFKELLIGAKDMLNEDSLLQQTVATNSLIDTTCSIENLKENHLDQESDMQDLNLILKELIHINNDDDSIMSPDYDGFKNLSRMNSTLSGFGDYCLRDLDDFDSIIQNNDPMMSPNLFTNVLL